MGGKIAMCSHAFLNQFLHYLDLASHVFKDSRSREHVREMGVAGIAASMPKTITSLVEFNGIYGNPKLNHDNWSASYRLLSTGKWKLQELSWTLLDMALAFTCKDACLFFAVDDTLMRKTGRRIPGCSYARDPLSPPFQTNLIWGQRVICVSILIRSSCTSSYRSIPIFFLHIPTVKISSHASQEERETLIELQKKSRMSVAGRDLVNEIRRHLDAIGQGGRKMVICGDGSFANRAFMENPPHDTAMVCRCRSDLALFRPLSKEERKGKRLYGERLRTPAELGGDRSEPSTRLECGIMHQHAIIEYKSMNNVRWKTVLKKQPCSVLAIRGQFYSKYGRRNRTEPAYLVMTGDIAVDTAGDDLCIKLDLLCECYLLRWEIEVGFRDQKNWLGIGKAQVRNQTSVKRTPAFMSACYSMLLMASMKVFDDKRTADFKKLPKWRNVAPLRPSIRDMVELLKREICKVGSTAA